jgi:hypothetical protein
MIDTDKYTGHTPAPWETGGTDIQAIKVWTVDGFDEDDNWILAPRADQLLAVDAPLLLEEVKRLREAIERALAGMVGMKVNRPVQNILEEAIK